MKSFISSIFVSIACFGVLLCSLLGTTPALAAGDAVDGVYSTSIFGDFAMVKKMLRQELDADKFFVVKELNIGRNIQSFANKWGDNYNRHGYSKIYSLVICNAWYVNEIINVSPAHMSLCPLSVSLLHKDNNTDIHYALRQAAVPMDGNSRLGELMRDLDRDFIEALDNAVARIRQKMAGTDKSGK